MSLSYRAAKCCENCDRRQGAWCYAIQSIVDKSAVCDFFKKKEKEQ